MNVITFRISTNGIAWINFDVNYTQLNAINYN